MKRRAVIFASAALGIAAVSGLAGYILAGGNASESAPSEPAGRKILYWYDPMIPDERHPGPGKSSMGMELMPKYADEGADGGIKVSPVVMQNLGIRMAKVTVRDMAPTVRAVGRVEFDERLISEVQTLTPGFVESLSIRAEGEPIGGGRVVAQVYSPELLAAQNEYKALLSTRSPASAKTTAHLSRGCARRRDCHEDRCATGSTSLAGPVDRYRERPIASSGCRGCARGIARQCPCRTSR
jgi:Cu(I)/Ag(I) efflux system membrane fusion protein